MVMNSGWHPSIRHGWQ